MDDAAELIRAIADLLGTILWPLVAFLVFVSLRAEVPGFVGRIRRMIVRLGKERSLELELDRLSQTRDEIEKGTAEVERQLPPGTAPGASDELPEAVPEPHEGEDASPAERAAYLAELPQVFDPVRAIEAGTPPQLIIIGLSAEIERQARRLLATFSDPSAWKTTSIGQLLARLELPTHIREAANEFRQVRNAIVHGGRATGEDMARAVDLGIAILQAINRIPRVVHVVKQPKVDVFEDAAGRVQRDGVHGVVLESTSDEGKTSINVYPSTREFEAGKAVSWEWNTKNVWPESWYRDPETGEIKYAWTSAGEFIGRPLDDL